jgi:hypothetical protein
MDLAYDCRCFCFVIPTGVLSLVTVSDAISVTFGQYMQIEANLKVSLRLCEDFRCNSQVRYSLTIREQN